MYSWGISAPIFEIDYMNEWRKYRDLSFSRELSKNNQEYFDRIFTALDIYCSNPDLRDENDFDDSELLNEVIKINEEWCLSKD
ncbi:colicin immunity domain-containing protein [Morganella morganii]|uniref:colicin immunity domain-containing protein n=1 Tax=Morganella morganii TaxID=582 RepID=UPI003CD0C47C